MENESYCWALSRYIHLNPVRAKMVDCPEDYAWSSYRHYLRSRTAPEWLDWRTVLAEIGKDPAGARKRYRRFVEQGSRTRSLRRWEVVGRCSLGSVAWVEAMRKRLSASGADPNVAELRHLAWRPSPEQIELAVAEACRCRCLSVVCQADQKQRRPSGGCLPQPYVDECVHDRARPAVWRCQPKRRSRKPYSGLRRGERGPSLESKACSLGEVSSAREIRSPLNSCFVINQP